MALKVLVTLRLFILSVIFLVVLHIIRLPFINSPNLDLVQLKTWLFTSKISTQLKEEPLKHRGILRWEERSPPNGSVRDSTRFRELVEFDDFKFRNTYIKRWENLRIPVVNPDGPKTILYFNDLIGNVNFHFGEGREPFLKAGCPYSNCFATHNRSLLRPEDANAIVWHHHSDNRILPTNISLHTRFVYFMMESQDNLDTDIRPLGNLFNYTMTFADHSDVHNPYGIIIQRDSPLQTINGSNHADGKSKMAVWFVSNCHVDSFREGIVKRLKEFFPVDIFGGCGAPNPPKCGKVKYTSPESCFRTIERTYKFYLSFENSLCKNYITEKFFKAIKYDMIPVVYGLGSYDTLAPPKSYINALDFAHVEDLANYIMYLDGNDTAYNEYFSWKVNYQSLYHYKEHKPPPYNKLSWCQLCEKLHTDSVPQTYSQIYPFDGPEHHCMNGKSPVMEEYMFGLTKKHDT